MFVSFCAILALFAAAIPARADDFSLLEEARQARAEAIPTVAVQKLRVLLSDKQLAAELRIAGSRELAAALLETGQTEEALGIITPLSESGDFQARLLHARVLAAQGNWTEAEAIYQDVCTLAEAPVEAQLGEAECLRSLDRPQEAERVLEKCFATHPKDAGTALRLASVLVDLGNGKRAREVLTAANPAARADQKWKSYLEARLLLTEGQAEPALEIFEELRQDPSDAPESLLFGAVLGSSAARVVLNGYDAADTVIEKFIQNDPESPFLEAAFRQLDVIYSQQEHPSDSELKKWAPKPPAARAALALYYHARAQARARKLDRAVSTLDKFVQTYPEHPLVSAAHLLRTDIFLARGDLAAAVSALEAAMRHADSDAQRAEIELRKGLAQDRQGEALLAAESFRRAAEAPGRLRMDATFDAALEALRMRNYDRFIKDYRSLSAAYPDTPLLSDLALEEGLSQARTGDPRAAETIDLFLHRFPRHPRQSEARMALADLAYANGDAAGAARLLKVANENAPTAETAESGAYLAIFLADNQSPGADEKVIQLASAFLKEHPGSEHAPDVRMKLGQVHFRNNHYPNAETEFTLLAQSNPSGPYAEPALFLAGRAAMKTLNAGSIERALGLFAEVVKRGGPLKLYARQQQASIQHSLGKEAETVTIYENILSAEPPPGPDLRFASLCGKGDSLKALGHDNSAQLEAAIAVFDELAAQPDVTPDWRNQALYKKGKTLEQLGRRDEAITAYYDVLDKSGADGREFFWYYKAGFDAAHLFEQQSQWKSAIGIYEKIARVEGPRAAEARARVSELRLSKFIW